MDEAGFQDLTVFSANTAVQSVSLFVQAALESDVLIQMSGETAPTVGLIPRINLAGVNPHAISNQMFIEKPERQMAIPAHEVTERGLAEVLCAELDKNQGKRLLANMDRAANLPINGAQTIAEEINSLV